MAKGFSLHIGVNAVDPVHYSGWSGELAACEFDAESMLEIAQQCSYEAGSLFTATLLKVWNNGKFDGDYTAFHGEIIKRMPAIQQPNHFVIGPPAPAFDRQRPFDIAG